MALACAASLVFQAMLSPLVAPGTSSQNTETVAAAAMFLASPFCHDDAGNPSGKAGHSQHDCCLLCQGQSRDAMVVLAFVLATLTLDPAREAREPAYANYDDASPRLIGWASSWSSRAPPFFS
ncbi:DUF2946 family protein [Methylocystis sp. ATCC 49242]|uniref:DUF2946 family protein n=1 Tax=Methylocystis sp. ATCC 49242 TaxID=622637 RepID=UPI0035289396